MCTHTGQRLVAEPDYTAFGAATAAGIDGKSSYNGQDCMGGLIYMRNRWYDPNMRRFTQQHAIGFAGGINPYAKAGNDPVIYSNPFGLCPPEAEEGISVSTSSSPTPTKDPSRVTIDHSIQTRPPVRREYRWSQAQAEN